MRTLAKAAGSLRMRVRVSFLAFPSDTAAGFGVSRAHAHRSPTRKLTLAAPRAVPRSCLSKNFEFLTLLSVV